MISIAALPTVNAWLNAATALLVCLGYVFIRRRLVRLHRRCMLAAVGLSVLFLASYLAYHAQVGVTRFSGEGTLRTLYLAVLWSHTVLATALLALGPLTLWLALTARFERHARLARWTLPMCLYVSVTGVVIYWLVYRI